MLKKQINYTSFNMIFNFCFVLFQAIMSIKEFYNGCDIFLTGGTGFMGKVLIEKLLRSCPGIRNIYVLMRHRKDKCITDRVKDMLALPVQINIHLNIILE